MLHNLRMLGPEKCQAEFENRSKISPGVTTKPGKKPPQFLNKLRGEIAYIGMVRGKDDVLYQKLKFNLESILHPTREIMRPLVSSNDEKRDVFICHASEDKTLIVEPLVAALSRRGVSVWYDRTHIGWGDSISGSINEGLRTSRYVLVVLSTAFIVKEWARRELNAAIGAEIRHGETSVLPLVVGDAAQQKQVLDAFPFHADKLHRIWLGDAELIADELVGLVRTR
jgi:hypothetical protein